jgi:glyoxylase-like metal-dependent hydrolase (beta-lactamase superfamily II)
MLINTEPHSDHVGGNCLFRQEGIPIFGIPGAERHDDEWDEIMAEYNESIVDIDRKRQREGNLPFKNTSFANPDHFVTEEVVLDLGEVKARIIPTPGHTPQNLSIYVEGDGVLYCGDCVIENYRPNLEDDSPQATSDWKQSLERVRSLNPKFVVPGHGDVLRGDSITEEIQRHLTFIHERSSTR